MDHPELLLQSSGFVASDIASLYSHFGQIADSQPYQEVAQHDAACQAAQRWPLLAAMQNLLRDDAGGGAAQ